jgi:CRISPR-associated protein Csb1
MAQGSIPTLSLKDLQAAVCGTAAAFRCVTEYEPVGGSGDRIFPPTYESGKYATEDRLIDGASVPCVLLDSVQSQANRMEQALLEAWERGKISLPVVTVDFMRCDLPKPFRVTSLEAPHRIADALLRDSLLGGKAFRKSELGRRLDLVSNRDATALFELCPTSLVFGMWDSTGPRGGLGAKFARAVASEIVGIDFREGTRTSSRIDPAQIPSNAGPLYQAVEGDEIGWTLDLAQAARDNKKQPILYNRSKNAQGKPGNPSKANHGNVTPSIERGSVTIRMARQTTVLSLPALRRLRFPLPGEKTPRPETDLAAHVALAALGLCAAALSKEQGCDLRSRCQLHPTQPFVWRLLDQPGDTTQPFLLPPEKAVTLLRDAVAQAKKAGLPWMETELVLTPSPQLAELVRRSQELAASSAEAGEGEA